GAHQVPHEAPVHRDRFLRAGDGDLAHVPSRSGVTSAGRPPRALWSLSPGAPGADRRGLPPRPRVAVSPPHPPPPRARPPTPPPPPAARGAGGGPAGRPPGWGMGRAGGWAREFNRRRAGLSFYEFPENVGVSAGASLLPRRFGVDAIILFYDITTLTVAMGLP